MRVKTLVTVLLLAFVAVSPGFMIFKEGRVQRLAEAFKALTGFERWARRITEVIFIGRGMYYCLSQIFGVSL